MATSRTHSVRSRKPRAATAARRPGGFTLIEILIALTIAVTLMALVSPPLVRWVGEYRFREALSQAEAALVRVRAGAQRSGNAVEVLRTTSGDHTRLIQREIDLGSGGAAPDDEARDPGASLIVFEFPAGFVLDDPEPEASVAPTQNEGMAPPPELVEKPATAEPRADNAGVVLMVFLPDGSASRGPGPGVISDPSGRRARLKLNSWTGKVEFLPDPASAVASRPAPARSRSRRVGRCTARRARGGLLLETMVALAIFVAGGLAVLSLVNRAAASMSLARDYRAAADLARSAMAQIEAGIATPQTLNGPVAAWDSAESGDDTTEIGAGFADAPPPPSPWELEISTEPSAFDGLTLVRVKAVRRAGESSESTRASYTLRQLVRLGSGGTESVGDLDPLGESAQPRRAPAPGREPSEGGGS